MKKDGNEVGAIEETPEEFPFIETESEFDVTIEVVESGDYEARLAEFMKLTGKAVSEYVMRLDGALKESEGNSFYEEYAGVRRELLKGRRLLLLIKERRIMEKSIARSDASYQRIVEETEQLGSKIRRLEKCGPEGDAALEEEIQRSLARTARLFARHEKEFGRTEPSDGS